MGQTAPPDAGIQSGTLVGMAYLKTWMGTRMGFRAVGRGSSWQVGYRGTQNAGFSTLKLCVLGLMTARL